MAEPKTKKTRANVDKFLRGVADEKKRQDAYRILQLMQEVTGEPPAMWGTSIVGFGKYQVRYASGREGEWPVTGFSPRKQNLTLYIMAGFDGYDELLTGLGKHKTGKACLYINKLEDVDLPTLKELVKRSVDHIARPAPAP